MAEPTVSLRNTVTGKRVSVPYSALPHYLRAAVPRSGAPMFEATGPLPGFFRNPDGSWKHETIPKERAHEVALRMFDQGYQHSLALGKDDPRWEAARQTEARRLRAKFAEEASGTFASRALSVASAPLTFASDGRIGWTQFENLIGGEGSQQARIDRMRANPYEVMGGTLGGMALLGSLPIPGAPRAGGWLGRGGKAGPEAVNVHNLFEISTAGAQGARAIVDGSSTFVKSLAGTTAGAAIGEVPLSMALAAADTVDNNKEWSAQAVIADGVGLAALGMGFAVAGGVALAGARQLLQTGGVAAGRGKEFIQGVALRVGTSKMVSKLQEGSVLGRTGRQVAMSAGFEAEQQARHAIYRGAATKKAAEQTTGGKWMRFIMGDRLDDYIQAAKSNQKLINGLTPKKDGAKIVDDLTMLEKSINDPTMATMAKQIIEYADGIYPAFKDIKEVAGHLAGMKEILKNDTLRYRIPQGVDLPASFHADVLTEIGNMYAKAKTKKMRKALNDLTREIQGKGDPIVWQGAIKASNLAKQTRGHITLAGDLDRIIVNAAGDTGPEVARGLEALNTLRKLTKNSDNYQKQFRDLRNISDNQMVGDMNNSAAGITQAWKSLEKSGLVYRKASQVPKGKGPGWGAGTAPGHKIDKMNRVINKMAKEEYRETVKAGIALNKMRRQLQMDVSPLVRNPRKYTQAEMLEMQVNSLTDAKQRFIRTFQAAAAGGVTRNVTTYGGVLAFREMKSQEEKRIAFDAYRELVLRAGSSPEEAISIIGPAAESISRIDTQLGAHFAQGLLGVSQYLLQHMPKSTEPGVTEFSSAEMEEWLERCGALEDPISVLACAADGSITPEAVDAIRTVYPSVYIDMMLDLIQLLNEHPEQIGQAQMLSFDTFLGGALGMLDGFTPIQPPYAQTPTQSQAMGAIGQQRYQQAVAQATPAQKVGAL